MRRLLIVMGTAMAALEAVNAPMLGEMWPVAAVFAGIFAGLTLWFVRRGTTLPVVLLGGLFLFELVMVPGYERTAATDWIIQGLAGAIALVGLIASVGVIVAGRRTRRTVSRVEASAA